MEYKYLMYVTTDNNNRYYEMKQTSPDAFIAEYGRVGSQGVKRPYKMKYFQEKYNEKIKEGYVDITDSKKEVVSNHSSFLPIKDEKIRNVIEFLTDCSSVAVKKNYEIDPNLVTQQMIENAQTCIDQLVSASSLDELNCLLLALFAKLPRKMPDVNSYLATDMAEQGDIISRESDVLNLMRAQVVTQKAQAAEMNILESAGIKMRECNADELHYLYRKMRTKEETIRFKNAYKVTNLETEKRFNRYCRENDIVDKDKHLYFHGTINSNIWPIMCSGLVRKSKTAGKNGRMFGYGIYFARNPRKSLNYTSIGFRSREHGTKGFLFLFEVAYKNPLHITKWTSKCSGFDNEYMKKTHHDATFAHKGESLVNDEIIIYDEAQATLSYVLEF